MLWLIAALLGIIVALLISIILVLRAEAERIREFLHALHKTEDGNGHLLGAIIRGVDSVQFLIESGQQSKGPPES